MTEVSKYFSGPLDLVEIEGFVCTKYHHIRINNAIAGYPGVFFFDKHFNA